jgi:YHS domain-containing protein
VTKVVLYLLAFVLIIGVARAALRIVMKGFADLFDPNAQPSSSPGPRPRASTIPSSEALKKDPVCGTFIAPSSAVQKVINGQTYYFCSNACRDQFRG